MITRNKGKKEAKAMCECDVCEGGRYESGSEAWLCVDGDFDM